MGHLDQQAMSNQLRRLHNAPTAVRGTSGPMRALPMHAFPLQQSCGKQVENAITPDDEGITALDYNTPAEPAVKDAKPTFGSLSSIENERPCTPDIGITMDHRTSTPDVFRPGDPGSGPRITSTPAMRGGVFSRMVGMDGPAPTPIVAPIPRLQRVVSIASTGSLPEGSQDPKWPGLSHDSTKDSKGGIGTPANHHSGRIIQAVKLNHRSEDNLMADSNEVDVQDRKVEPLLQNEDLDKAIPSLDTGKEVQEEEIVDSQRLNQDGDKQGAINKQFPVAQENSQHACDGLPDEIVSRKEVTKDLKKDCPEILNRTLDLQPSTDVNVDGSQATNNENEINVEEPDVLTEEMPSGNVHQSEFRNNTAKPLVDIANHEVRADCEKQTDTAVITQSQSSSSIEVKANCEASDACDPDLLINIDEKNPTLSIVPQVIQSIQTEVCLNDTFEAEQSDSSAKIKTEGHHIQQENIPEDKNNLSERPGKDICAERKVNNSQAERPRPKRNISAESNESSNNEGESHTSSEMNAESNRQTRLKRSSLTHARKVPTPVSSAKPNLKTTKKLDTSKSSTCSNTSFSKVDQKTSLKKVGGQSSRPTATDNKNPQAMVRPALGIRRSLPHSSPSQKSNNSITKSNKENTLGKQVDGNIKHPETQIKSKLSLTKGINPPKRTVLGSSNIQIRKSIVVQPEKQKNGLALTKNSPLRATTGALKNKDPGESLKGRTKSVQSNSTHGQDIDNKTTSQGRLKPPSKRMKPSSPLKSPPKAELKQPQKLPQPTQKIAVASHASGFTSKMARPQMASGLQPPAAQSKITSSGNSAVSKLPGLRPPSNIKPVAVKRVSGIMPPTANKPNVLRPPRPMAR
ncbi:dentin sialophosphoprotein-like [Penaeus indicus]|uniref:dentin sialophosphoprotein-like n=1 Tax=Penaeus indicus TaxID=29960 RepID=UPI00300D482F